MMRMSSGRPGGGGEQPTDREGDLSLGMRRVAWVRITIEPAAVRAEVVGVGHRLPVTRPVPLVVAAALVADGIPSVVRHHPDHQRQQERRG